MAGKAHKRDVTGLLLLDKPAGATSNHILQKVRYLYAARKAGHTGSLDPAATGMLPICFGEATKLCGYLLDSNKTYDVEALLGVTTDTEDADGTVIATAEVPDITTAALADVVDRFSGKLLQRPPVYSALKRNGVRVHKLARKGIDVELEPRPIEVFAIALNAFDGSRFSLSMQVSKGTYVRSIVRDIGEIIGCGAHVTALRRTAVSPFEQQALISMDKLEKAANRDDFLLRADCVVANRSAITIADDIASRFCHGAKPLLDSADVNLAASGESDVIRVYDQHQRFLGLGNVRDGRLHTVRLIAGG